MLEKKSLTAGSIDGDGVFDELMRSVKSHLQTELDSGNLTSNNFAAVYTGALQYTLSEASGYLLRYEEVNNRNLLLAEQIKSEAKKVLIDQAQLDKMVVDLANATKQGLLLDEQLIAAKEQTNLLKQQVIKLTSEVALTDKQLDILTAQEANTIANTNSTIQNTANALLSGDLISEQILKTSSEVAILQQKKFTEEAQILDTVNGAAVSGVIGKQKELYQNQAEGFLRDAEQKATKMLIDTWQVRRTTDSDGTEANDINGLNDVEIGKFVTMLKSGVNIPL